MNQPKKFELFVDGEKYEWPNSTITGEDLRKLAGIPESAQIFEHVPGKPDIEIKNNTVVNLEKHHGPVKFSTQSPGSQAG
jgi:Multiubiquitin